MKAGRQDARRIWTLSTAIGAVVFAGVLLLFHSPRAPAPLPAVRVRPSLRLEPPKEEAANPVFREDAEVHDATPLFLPTQWNSAPKDPPKPEDEGVLKPFEANLVFDAKKLEMKDLDLPPSHRIPARPADALADSPADDPFLGIGRGAVPLPALAPRGALVEIVAVETGRLVFRKELNDIKKEEADSPPSGGAWQFMAEVDDAGLVGTLVPTVRSGTQADIVFLNYLAKKLRVGDRLPPGLYRISVGP